MLRAAALTLAAVAAAGAGLAGEVKLLCDFEKESVAKWAEFRKKDDKSYTARCGGCYGCNFTATQGPATSGKWSLSHTFPARSDCRYMPGVRDGQHLPSRKLFSSGGRT